MRVANPSAWLESCCVMLLSGVRVHRVRLVTTLTILLLAAAAVLGACGGGDDERGRTTVEPADFQAEVDNLFWPLASVKTAVFEGEERDPETGEVIAIRVESAVLPDAYEVLGIEVTVVEVKEYEDGELVESTLDYYAQHRDGTVYYFGERVDDYEGDRIVGHSGQWLAGEGKNEPGLFMPAGPALGQTFEQERAPGIAEDRSTVIGVDEAVTTAAGSFEGCIRTEDVNPLDNTTENKVYCEGVGLVREESSAGSVGLISYGN